VTKIVVEEPPLEHLQIIVVIFSKTYDLLQNLLQCGFRVARKFFQQNNTKTCFFRWDVSVVGFAGHSNRIDLMCCLVISKYIRSMTGKSQAKTKCETLKVYPRNLWKRRTRNGCFSFTPPDIHPCSEVGGNEWKETTKREHG